MYENSELLDLKKALWRLETACEALKESQQNDLKIFKSNLNDLHAETQRFMSHIDEYGKVGEKIGPTIAHYIKEATEQLSESISQELNLQIEEKIKSSLYKIDQSASQASQALEYYKIGLSKRIVALTFAFCFGAIITSLGIVWFVPFKLKPYLTNDMMHTYGWGVIIKNAMPHLSREEKNQLKKILRITS